MSPAHTLHTFLQKEITELKTRFLQFIKCAEEMEEQRMKIYEHLLQAQQEIVSKIMQSEGKFRQIEENLAKLEKKIENLQVSIMNKGNVTMGALEGTPDLSDMLHNICFIRGVASDRIQTTARNRKYRI